MVKSLACFISLIVVLCISHFALAQSPNFSGAWGGTMVTEAGPSGVQITLRCEEAHWKAEMKLLVQWEEVSPAVQDLAINGEEISFAAELGSIVVKFAGTFAGDKVSGIVEVFQEGKKIRGGGFALVRGGQMSALQQTVGQMADENFNTKVERPAYKKSGPRVLFDEAHNNFHTSNGRYKPFADLITNDGYQVVPNKQTFTRESLKGFPVLVISNALGAPRMGDAGASNSAFTEEECNAVRDWVKSGGSLLLIADHAPMGSANQALGQRFGVDMSKMYTADEQNYDQESGNRGFIVYTRQRGRLADHPVTRGRNGSERVNKVIAFTGQSLKGPADASPFLKLADTAVDAMPGQNTKPASAAGRAQGIAIKFGKGRVIVMGEAGMLSAQVVGPQRMLFGMNRPGIDNRQLALNIMHWLSGLLKQR